MDGGRRFKGNSYNQEVSKASNFRKPPAGKWQETVPAWEKKFCTFVCRIPWKKIVDAKRYMPYHDNVVKWDDSAAEEAFNNAKYRFYAKMNGFPCDIPEPVPNLYADEIDWDAEMDTELLLDWEREPDPATLSTDEHVVDFGDALFRDNGFSGVGWGDCEEFNTSPKSRERNYGEYTGPIIPTGWGDNEELKTPLNSWEHNYVENTEPIVPTGWGDGGENSSGWYDNSGTAMAGSGWEDSWGNSGWGDGGNNAWGFYQDGAYYGSGYVQEDPNAMVHGTWYVNHGNRQGTGGFIPEYGASRNRGGNYQRNQARRNASFARKRVNLALEQRKGDDGSGGSRGNLRNSFVPKAQLATGKAGNQWRMEKPVS